MLKMVFVLALFLALGQDFFAQDKKVEPCEACVLVNSSSAWVYSTFNFDVDSTRPGMRKSEKEWSGKTTASTARGIFVGPYMIAVRKEGLELEGTNSYLDVNGSVAKVFYKSPSGFVFVVTTLRGPYKDFLGNNVFPVGTLISFSFVKQSEHRTASNTFVSKPIDTELLVSFVSLLASLEEQVKCSGKQKKMKLREAVVPSEKWGEFACPTPLVP